MYQKNSLNFIRLLRVVFFTEGVITTRSNRMKFRLPKEAVPRRLSNFHMDGQILPLPEQYTCRNIVSYFNFNLLEISRNNKMAFAFFLPERHSLKQLSYHRIGVTWVKLNEPTLFLINTVNFFFQDFKFRSILPLIPKTSV